MQDTLALGRYWIIVLWLIRSVYEVCAFSSLSKFATPRRIVENICLMCNQAEKQSKSHFCGAICSDAAEKAGPAILEVPSGHATFDSGERHSL
jgi:hypothetical protein